jgi:hypothetical protein
MSIRQAVLHFGVAVSSVLFWVKRAGQQRLDRVRWLTYSIFLTPEQKFRRFIFQNGKMISKHLPKKVF